MLQAILDRVPLLRIENQHLLKQAMGIWVGLREDLFHRLFVSLRKFANVAPGQIVTDEAHVVGGGRAENRNRALDLV